MCSRFLFLPTSGFVDELSVSSEELAARNSEDDAMPTGRGRGRLDAGRSGSRSTMGESSEQEVGGVNIANIKLWEELLTLAALLLANVVLLSGTDSADESNAVFLSPRGRRLGRSVITTDSLLLVPTLLATDDRRALTTLDPYCTLLLRGRFEDVDTGKGSSVSSIAADGGGGGGGGEVVCDLDLVGPGDSEVIIGGEGSIGMAAEVAGGGRAAAGERERRVGEVKELEGSEGTVGVGVGYGSIREFCSPSVNSCL